MTEKLDFEKYKKENDGVKLTQSQKNLIIENIGNYRKSLESNRNANSKGDAFFKIWISAAAVVLVFSLIACSVYFGVFGNDSDDFSGKVENSFFLTANASEYDGLDDNVIGVFSAEQGNCFGFFDENNLTDESYVQNGSHPNKSGKIDHFYTYRFSQLFVNGGNIESVEFSTDIKGLYFLYNNDNNGTEGQIECGQLSNSQYSQQEFDEFGDGIYGKFCDSFIYKNNPQDTAEQKFEISHDSLSFVVETDRSNPVVDRAMENYLELSEKLLKLRAENHKVSGEYGTTPPEQEQIHKELDDCNALILGEMLKNAFINVEVKFTDGSTQNHRLAVKCVRKSEILDKTPMIEICLDC